MNLRGVSAVLTLAASIVISAAASATASPDPTTDKPHRVYDYDFGKQRLDAVVVPLTIEVEASRPDIQFELWRVAANEKERLPDSTFAVRSAGQANGLWLIKLTIRQLPALNSHYSVCASGRAPNHVCQNGLLQSFYAFDPAFSRNLKVGSSGNTISARATFKLRAPSPSSFSIKAAVQRYSKGSWRTLRVFSKRGPLLLDNAMNATVPSLAQKYAVPYLQRLLRQGVRFRVQFQYRFVTGTGQIITQRKPIRPVKSQKK